MEQLDPDTLSLDESGVELHVVQLDDLGGACIVHHQPWNRREIEQVPVGSHRPLGIRDTNSEVSRILDRRQGVSSTSAARTGREAHGKAFHPP